MNKEILRLAIPNIISNISTPLLSSVDILLMGNLSAAHLGAVGIGSMIFNLVYWNFGFLRMGTTGMTAQAFGAKDQSQIIHTLLRAALLAVLLAVVILALGKPLELASFFLLNVLPDQYELVASYFYIRLWAAPATFLIYALNGWLFGMQNAWYPLIATILINVVNIVLSYVLVHTYGLAIQGVAWGTVIAQYIGVVFLIGVVLFKYPSYFKYINVQVLRAVAPLKRFLSLNADIFIRTVFLTFAFGFFYSQSSKMGAMILAGNLILLQFVNWMSYGIDGFAYAAESLVGKYKGSENNQRLNDMINRLLKWGFGLAIFYTLIFFFFGDMISSVFTNDIEVLDISKEYFVWILVIPIVAFLSYLWDGIFIGLTASKAMRNSMFAASLVYLISYFLLLKFIPTNHALWFSLSLFLLARGIIQSLQFRKHKTTLI